jgi:hypothetical protein
MQQDRQGNKGVVGREAKPNVRIRKRNEAVRSRQKCRKMLRRVYFYLESCALTGKQAERKNTDSAKMRAEKEAGCANQNREISAVARAAAGLCRKHVLWPKWLGA